MTEYGDKLEADEKAEVEQQIAAVRDAASKDDIDLEDLKAKVEALQQASQKIGEKIYKDAGSKFHDDKVVEGCECRTSCCVCPVGCG